ncbi:MAG: peptide chain release factor N(5)-glutamine methyltransferase [Gammaproteobacteria bacterium]|nr:peptide chain release factor N(5)-glutamine methyltransferase [Gammaproteobacteria bacterium]
MKPRILSLHDILRTAPQQLPCSDSARLDVEVLLAHAIRQPREHLHTWPEYELTPAQYAEFSALINKRRDGWPVAYLTGHQAFWTLDLLVTPATLIPRPETELLVETALQLLPAQPPRTVIDMGTGSGAIALAIGKERLHWQIHAVDVSGDALDVARNNAQRHRIHNVTFHHSNWLTSLPGDLRADIIVSNPPYIAERDPHLQQGDVRFEPATALVAGIDGLDAIRTLLATGHTHLQTNAWLVIEHGYDQATATQQLFAQHHFQEIQQQRDLAGHLRVTAGKLSRSK